MTFYKNHKEKLELLKSGRLSLVEIVKHLLKNIEDQKDLNAFNFIFNDEAIEVAPQLQTAVSFYFPTEFLYSNHTSNYY